MGHINSSQFWPHEGSKIIGPLHIKKKYTDFDIISPLKYMAQKRNYAKIKYRNLFLGCIPNTQNWVFFYLPNHSIRVAVISQLVKKS